MAVVGMLALVLHLSWPRVCFAFGIQAYWGLLPWAVKVSKSGADFVFCLSVLFDRCCVSRVSNDDCESKIPS